MKDVISFFMGEGGVLFLLRNLITISITKHSFSQSVKIIPFIKYLGAKTILVLDEK